eukprot:jgi/Botrbrau1/4055/Bobra.152_3s0012.1
MRQALAKKPSLSAPEEVKQGSLEEKNKKKKKKKAEGTYLMTHSPAVLDVSQASDFDAYVSMVQEHLAQIGVVREDGAKYDAGLKVDVWKLYSGEEVKIGTTEMGILAKQILQDGERFELLRAVEDSVKGTVDRQCSVLAEKPELARGRSTGELATQEKSVDELVAFIEGKTPSDVHSGKGEPSKGCASSKVNNPGPPRQRKRSQVESARPEPSLLKAADTTGAVANVHNEGTASAGSLANTVEQDKTCQSPRDAARVCQPPHMFVKAALPGTDALQQGESPTRGVEAGGDLLGAPAVSNEDPHKQTENPAADEDTGVQAETAALLSKDANDREHKLVGPQPTDMEKQVVALQASVAALTASVAAMKASHEASVAALTASHAALDKRVTHIEDIAYAATAVAIIRGIQKVAVHFCEDEKASATTLPEQLRDVDVRSYDSWLQTLQDDAPGGGDALRTRVQNLFERRLRVALPGLDKEGPERWEFVLKLLECYKAEGKDLMGLVAQRNKLLHEPKPVVVRESFPVVESFVLNEDIWEASYDLAFLPEKPERGIASAWS